MIPLFEIQDGHPFYPRDKALTHNLSVIPDDWLAFGTVKFNEKVGRMKCLRFWYDLVKTLERRNRGNWLVGTSINPILTQHQFLRKLGQRISQDSSAQPMW